MGATDRPLRRHLRRLPRRREHRTGTGRSSRRRYHDDFDAWAADVREPVRRQRRATTPTATGTPTAGCAEMEADGVVAEVIFPNTDPAVLPEGRRSSNQPPGRDATATSNALGRAAGAQPLAGRLLRRGARAGGPASRRSCCTTSTRRSTEIEWARPNGLTGGVLLPGAPPGSGVPPLYAPDYEPIWSACEELGMPVNHHSGSAVPDTGPYPAAKVMFLLEVTWWAHRTLWHLIFSGVHGTSPRRCSSCSPSRARRGCPTS